MIIGSSPFVDIFPNDDFDEDCFYDKVSDEVSDDDGVFDEKNAFRQAGMQGDTTLIQDLVHYLTRCIDNKSLTKRKFRSELTHLDLFNDNIVTNFPQPEDFCKDLPHELHALNIAACRFLTKEKQQMIAQGNFQRCDGDMQDLEKCIADLLERGYITQQDYATIFSKRDINGWDALTSVAKRGGFNAFRFIVNVVLQLTHYSKDELINIFTFASIHFDRKNIFILAAERPEDGYECLQILKSHPIAKEVYQQLLDIADNNGKTLREYEKECEKRYKQRLENKRKATDAIDNPNKRTKTGN